MPLSYKNGDKWCGKCYEWVRSKDIERLTYKNKAGQLTHECGGIMRTGRRQELESTREDRIRHRSPIKFSRQHKIRADIIKNKEKWEQLIKRII